MTNNISVSQVVDMYTKFSLLKDEVLRRRSDQNLVNKVKDFFREVGVPVDDLKPKAFFSRSVATPNLEFLYFIDLAKELGFEPCFLEYPDKFVSLNSNKYHVGNIKIYTDDSYTKTNNYKIIDFNKFDGKSFNEIKTLTGQSLIDFHHDFLLEFLPEMNGKIVNFFDWFNLTRKGEYYYLYYLSLFICGGVLFENFLQNDSKELSFVESKIIPSFNKAVEIFGVKPLIYPLLPLENECQKDWLAYPIHTKDYIERKIGDIIK